MRKIFIKRALDIIASLLLIIASIPIWLFAIFIILLSDFGPIFFKQTRIGQNLEPFKIYKFRTMKLNYDDNKTTKFNDKRVFKFGHILRKYKIDELPQLINVIGGDMSLVGPRPTSIDDVEKMNSIQKDRHTLKPGMTGLAQISGNTSLKWSERIKFDLYYVNNWTLYLDIKIMLKTLLQVLSGKADTHPLNGDEWN
jgi:lipopolysaccharide/colanic/teichoic acid biosynthesis glycosyltransferase